MSNKLIQVENPTTKLASYLNTPAVAKQLSIVFFLCVSLLFMFLPLQKVYAHAGHGTGSDDAYWANLAKDYPTYKLPGLARKKSVKKDVSKAQFGFWSDVIEWPHIAVTAASLPDGRVLTFSSFGRQKFVGGNGKEFTYAATWDPESGDIIEHNHHSHDLFAAHLTLLEDGRLLVNGGNNRVPTTSFFNYKTNQWTKGAPMKRGRWYPTTVSLPNGSVFTALGTAGGQYPELWTEAQGWKVLTGINLQKPILDYESYYEREWWPLFHIDPRGKVFHSGPTPTMHAIDTKGLGSIKKVGTENHAWYPKHGTTVMYDEGKLLVAGGAIAGNNQKSTNKAMVIDINGATPVVNPIEPMKFARKFHNGVILPNGEVLVIGGNTSGIKFSDSGTILAPEIWNPDTKKWRTVASMSVPRNYHSVALLLKDGRVFSSGGGLCAPCAADHPNTQIYSPPYLYDEKGKLAHRPIISNAPDSIKHGQILNLHSDNDITLFSMVKMSSTTHAINTDLRFLKVPFKAIGQGEYELTMHANRNVLTPGFWMLYAINSKGVPSVAKIIQVKTQGAPIIKQPQSQAHRIGSKVSLTISAEDPNNETLTYSANNLPQGLSIDASTGEITGTVNQKERKTVTVSVTNSSIKSEISFDWQVYPLGKVAGVSYDYYIIHDNPSELPDLSPLDPEESGVVADISLPDITPGGNYNYYALRLSSRLLIETQGEYTFYLNSKDGSKLWIDDMLIIDNDGLHNAQEKRFTLFLSEGEHALKIAYFNTDHDALLELRYQGPGIEKQAIPNTAFIQNPLHNVAPVIQDQNIGEQTYNTNASVDLAIIANDANGDPLHFTAEGLPAGVQINPDSGHIFGTTTTVGNFISHINVSDTHNETDSIQIKWQINGELSIDPIIVKPRPVGKLLHYTAKTNGGVNKRYQWDFGDNSNSGDFTSDNKTTHRFSKPGRYTITLTVKSQDTSGSDKKISYQFIQSVYVRAADRKLRPNVSMSIIYEQRPSSFDRLWNVNPDNNTVSVFNPFLHNKIAEIRVGKEPRSLAKNPVNGFIWVANKQSATVSIIDPNQLTVVDEIAMPHGSQPYGLVFSPKSHFAYITLQAGNKLVQINTDSRTISQILDVGSYPRHLAINATGKLVYISRFITPPLPDENTAHPKTEINGKHYGGELLVIDTERFKIKKTIILKHSERPDSARSARGIPNFLGTVALSPDGLAAWIPSKQDNIKRGTFRDGKPLTHDTVVRSISSRIDLVNETEQTEKRVDHDNAGIASAAIYGRYGNLVFVALEGSRAVEVIDAFKGEPIFRFDSGGHAPQGLALSADGLTLFIDNFMERTVTVFDLHDLVYNQSNSVNLIATYNLVEDEILTPDILRGKQLFYDSRDPRLAREEYSSCAQCHNEGISDGRVWDNSNFGEGLRNTISLIGHGEKNGPLHWSGNFDEVHDFEGQIRTLSGGEGLLSDEDFNSHSDPMGIPKKGLSEDMDSLANYVRSLNKIPDSPYKNADGSLTDEAKQGEKLFLEKGCNDCHSGPFFTDSAKNNLHDISTIKPSSGQRLGGPLTGINTPTLQGLWMTAPFLHDGRAKTLQDAIKVMRNKANQEIHTTARERDLLAAYLMQIDSHTPQPQAGNTEPTAPSSNSSGGGSLPLQSLLLLWILACIRKTKLKHYR